MFLVTNGTIIYLENPQMSTQKIIEQTSEFNKAIGTRSACVNCISVH